jgi:YVTN family beta-propeller protein
MPRRVSIGSLFVLVLTLTLGASQLWAEQATYQVSATIAVGGGPNGVAANPTTNRVYVANNADDTVSVIDARTYAVVATVPVGSAPVGVGVNPATNRVYVANAGRVIAPGTVSVIDGATNAVIATIATDQNPFAVAVNPVTNRVYVTNNFGTAGDVGDGILSVIDGSLNVVIDRVHVGVNPSGVAADSSTNRIYVAMYGFAGGSVLQVIDGASNAIVDTIGTTGPPWLADVNSQTHRVYVTQCGPFCDSTDVDVIDPEDGPIGPVFVGSNPYGVAVNSITNLVFASTSDGMVSVIDGSSDGVIQTIAVGPLPQGIGFNPATLSAFVANGGDGTVSVLSLFAGSPGAEDCHDASISSLARAYRGISKAALALRLSSVSALQAAVTAYCGQ